MSGLTFISYRRDDSLATTGRLYDHLVARFGSHRIFIDIDAIEPGLDFVEVIERAVGRCDVLLAVIGARWLQSTQADGRRRLEDPEDFVRLELGIALARDIRVIPVLVDGAAMPPASELPDELKPLARRNAIELGHVHFNSDIERLVQVLERVLAQAASPGVAPQPDGAERPDGEEDVIFACKAYKRWPLWVHLDCRLIVRRTGVEFVDNENPLHSFKISTAGLVGAVFTKPRGMFKLENDLLLLLQDGTEYEIGLDAGDREKVVAAVRQSLG
jgi:hypothetical protein